MHAEGRLAFGADAETRPVLGRGCLDPELGQRLLRSFLLGSLLRLSRAHPQPVAVDHGGAREAAVVRRAFNLEHGTNKNKKNAFGKCVSKLAKQQGSSS